MFTEPRSQRRSAWSLQFDVMSLKAAEELSHKVEMVCKLFILFQLYIYIYMCVCVCVCVCVSACYWKAEYLGKQEHNNVRR